MDSHIYIEREEDMRTHTHIYVHSSITPTSYRLAYATAYGHTPHRDNTHEAARAHAESKTHKQWHTDLQGQLFSLNKCHPGYCLGLKRTKKAGAVITGLSGGCEQIRKTQDEPQWIVAQRLLSSTYNT